MVDDELELLDRWCAGDRTAGSTLFHRHFASVYRFFQRKVDDGSDVDELVQDTFLACVRSRDSFRRQSRFRTYLFAIARHQLLHYWRARAGKAQPLDFDEVSVASLSTSAGSRLANREERARLLEALRELPLDLQLLIELYYWERLERDQLAEVFDVEPATTRSRLFRARETLRARLAVDAPRGPASGDDEFDAWARGLCPDPAELRDRNLRNDGPAGGTNQP